MNDAAFEIEITPEEEEAYRLGYSQAATGYTHTQTPYNDRLLDMEWLRGWCSYQMDQRRALPNPQRQSV